MSHYNYNDIIPFATLEGKTLTKVEKIGDDEILFVAENGEAFKSVHFQDCCEGVEVDEIVGDLTDLVGAPILRAEERTSEENPKDPSDAEYGTFTWTFYELATNKGSVTIKWYGSSNGYYSESVDLIRWREAA